MFALVLLTYNHTNLPQPTETSIEEEMEQIAVGFNLAYSVPRSNNSRLAQIASVKHSAPGSKVTGAAAPTRT
jgi:hypothetical protein